MGAERSAGGFKALVRRRTGLVATLALCATMIGSVVSVLLPRSFVAETRIALGATGGLAGAEFADRVKSVDERLLSHDTFADVVKDLGLASKFDALEEAERREKTEALASSIRTRTRIDAASTGDAAVRLTISHRSEDADVSMRVVGALSDRCAKLAAEQSSTAEQKAEEESSRLEKSAKDAYARARDEHAAFRKENHEFLDGASGKLQATRDEKKQLKDTTIAGLEQQKKQFTDMLAQEQQFKIEKRHEPDPARLAAVDEKLTSARERLHELTVEHKKSDTSPEVVEQRGVVSQLEQDRAKLVADAPMREARVQSEHWLQLQKAKFEVQSRLDGANLKLRQLVAQEKEQEELARRTPEFVAKDKALETAETAALKDSEARSQEHAKAQKALADVRSRGTLTVSAVDPPVKPDRPSGPGAIVLALAGLIAGAGAGMGVALALHRSDRSFREVEAVSGFLGVPTLGVVNVIRTPAEAARTRRARRRKLASLAALAIFAALVVAVALLGDAQAVKDFVKSVVG